MTHAVEKEKLCSVLLAGYDACARSWTSHSRLSDGCFRRYSVVRMSEADVRRDDIQPFGSANLIVHHSLANILHRIVEPLRVVGVVQEPHNIFLSCNQVQNLVDTF